MSDAISNRIDSWVPASMDPGDEGTDAVIVLAKGAVTAAGPRSPKQATIALGYVYRFFLWATADGEVAHADLFTIPAVESYIAHLQSEGMKRGSWLSIRSYLRRCATDGNGLAKRAEVTKSERRETSVQERIDGYTPNAEWMHPGRWLEIADAVRTAVRAVAPTETKRAGLLLRVTALYVSWAKEERVPDAGLFDPSPVERFIDMGGTHWELKTARTYASALRAVARANNPTAWPQRPKPKTEPVAPYSAAELAAIAKAISSMPARQNQLNLEAAFLLGVGAGIIGAEAARLSPDAVLNGDADGVRVGGTYARVVPIAADASNRLTEIAETLDRVGEKYLLGGTSGNKRYDRQGELWAMLRENGTHVEPQRLRMTWLVRLVSLPLPLQALFDMSGRCGHDVFAQALRWAEPYDRDSAHHTAAKGRP